MAKARICDLCAIEGKFIEATHNTGRKEKEGLDVKKFTLDLCNNHRGFFEGTKTLNECVERYKKFRTEKLSIAKK